MMDYATSKLGKEQRPTDRESVRNYLAYIVDGLDVKKFNLKADVDFMSKL